MRETVDPVSALGGLASPDLVDQNPETGIVASPLAVSDSFLAQVLYG